MKLNPKCIKDILSVFEATVNDAGVTYTYHSWENLQEEEPLQEYSLNELAYHCQQIYLSGYLYNGRLYPQGGISFMDITPEAHSLLANMRIPAVYKAITKFIGIAGSSSIGQMASIATEASTALLPDLLDLGNHALHKPQK